MALLRPTTSSLSSINITPLTDVLLVLLITFLLTASTFHGDSMKVALPQVMNAGELDSLMARVVVDSNGAVYLPDGSKVNLSLEAAFARLREQEKKPVLGLAIDRNLGYGKVYPILQAAQLAGWERLVVLTEAGS